GFIFGANYTNEGVGFNVAYTNDWVDTVPAEILADGMYSTGTDIIFTAAGRSSLGVFDSVGNNNETYGPLWVIGFDSPQMYLGTADPDNPVAPTLCLTSMLKRVDIAVYAMIEDAYESTFTGGEKLFNLANGGVDYEINEALLVLPAPVITQVEALRADIISGSVVVPDTKYWLP
ncbi:MAG: BMP family ABC transporter substrate-binding protein, partial [Candidatus Thorarchaeota archaeon]|nr:BMP family ABC transporter substrate-binding protein [Candidatus Thorarchaeota archaeon]